MPLSCLRHRRAHSLNVSARSGLRLCEGIYFFGSSWRQADARLLGPSGNYYCDYRRLPNRVCTPTATAAESCKSSAGRCAVCQVTLKNTAAGSFFGSRTARASDLHGAFFFQPCGSPPKRVFFTRKSELITGDSECGSRMADRVARVVGWRISAGPRSRFLRRILHEH